MRFLTAGESHGRALNAILDGIPRGVRLDFERIDNELKRRQQGLGRGERQKIERDTAQFLAGIRGGVTTGAPISILIENRDFWSELDAKEGDSKAHKLTAMRAGHADYAGCVKYGISDSRDILERSSGRNTATLVAIGAICKEFLYALDINITSEVVEVAGVRDQTRFGEALEKLRQSGDSAGGEICVMARGVPAGVGGYCQLEDKLDFQLSALLAGIGGVKSVGFGLGHQAARGFGSNFHDDFDLDPQGKITRKSNNAGGVEGGMSNGNPICVSIFVKPIPSLGNVCPSVDLEKRERALVSPIRADTSAVFPVAVVAEGLMAYCIADNILKKFGGDSMEEILPRWVSYNEKL